MPSTMPSKRCGGNTGDDKLFECAKAGEAQYIVSEDDDVLTIGEYQAVSTVSAVQFLAILDRA